MSNNRNARVSLVRLISTLVTSASARFNHWAKPLGLLAILLVPQALLAQQPSSKTIKIPDGTIVRVVLTDALSSGTNHVNDPVHFEAAEEVRVGDVVAFAKGATGIGHVTEAEPKGRWGKGGSLDFSLDYIKAVDGTNVRLRGKSTESAKNSTAALMLGLSGAFKKGKDVSVAKGTAMDAYVDGDREISPRAPTPVSTTTRR